MDGSVTGFKRRLEVLPTDLTNMTSLNKRIEFLLEITDVTNLVDNHHVNDGSRAHHRQAPAVSREGRIDFMDHGLHVGRQDVVPMRHSSKEPWRKERYRGVRLLMGEIPRTLFKPNRHGFAAKTLQ